MCSIVAAINIPNLPCNSQPVALFAIDAEQEKLQVQEFSRGGSKLSRTARSLPNIKLEVCIRFPFIII